MKTVIALLGLIVVVFACYPRSYEATAVVQPDLSITFTVSPMFGIHSDWTRTISVKHGKARIKQELFEDTGWWRGSHLYHHERGVYVIHEGQAGCFGFTTEPLSFDVPISITCAKNVTAQQKKGATSRYYAGLTYLGTFVETPNDPDGSPISFLSAEEKPETELPDLL